MNDTIAQQQAQINQLLAAQKPMVEPAAAVVIKPEPVAAQNATVESVQTEHPVEPEVVGDLVGKVEQMKVESVDGYKEVTEPIRKTAAKRKMCDEFIHWGKIMIKVESDDTPAEENQDEALVQDKITMIREHTIYQSKIILANCLRDQDMGGSNYTINCSKVRVDEVDTFHSVDMVAPPLRNCDRHARDHPHDALQGESLLVDRYEKMVQLMKRGERYAKFIVCSPKKGFISFYAHCFEDPEITSTASGYDNVKNLLTLQHHITLELKHLLTNVSDDELEALTERLGEAVDPSVKGIKLYQNIVRENRGGLLMCKINKPLARVNRGNRPWGLTFHNVGGPEPTGVQFNSNNQPPWSAMNYEYCRVYLFNDSPGTYKNRLKGSLLL